MSESVLHTEVSDTELGKNSVKYPYEMVTALCSSLPIIAAFLLIHFCISLIKYACTWTDRQLITILTCTLNADALRN